MEQKYITLFLLIMKKVKFWEQHKCDPQMNNPRGLKALVHINYNHMAKSNQHISTQIESIREIIKKKYIKKSYWFGKINGE